MKTQNQLDAIKLAEEFFQKRKDDLEELCQLAVILMKGYEPLKGTGNTHGDNMDVRYHLRFVMLHINATLTFMDSFAGPFGTEGYSTFQDYKHLIYQKYFENNEGFKVNFGNISF